MDVNTLRRLVLPLTISLAACGHAAGTAPHEMSTTQHEAAAAQEEQIAAAHAAQHDPNATKAEEHCNVTRGRVCWTDMVNPTEAHRGTAEEHQKLAGQHRAASQALRDAEARACEGLSAEDRDTSPFAHTADIESVSQYRIEKTFRGAKTYEDAGATIVFRATPGLTAEWLQRIVTCHLARNAAVGHDMPEMQYCPLVPRGAQATVHSVGTGFAVDVYAQDKAAIAEIWRRAQMLKPGAAAP